LGHLVYYNKEKINSKILKINNIPLDILQSHECSHSIERVNRHKHKISLKFSCKDLIDRNNNKSNFHFTEQILDEITKNTILKDEENNDIQHTQEFLNAIHIQAVISYSFILKQSNQGEPKDESNKEVIKFHAIKDYIKIYYSIQIQEKYAVDFNKTRRIFNKHISSSFYEKFIHHIHTKEVTTHPHTS